MLDILPNKSVDSSWNPNSDNVVKYIAVSPDGQTVYVAGDFATIGGQTRSELAALDTNGNATTWNPAPDGDVKTLVVSPDGTTIYAGGGFANIGGAARGYLAGLNNTNGNVTSWNPREPGGFTRLHSHPTETHSMPAAAST